MELKYNESLDFYIKTPTEIFQLPITPAECTVSFPALNKTINVLNFGEVSLLGSNALRTWSFSCFFPNQHYSFCRCTPKDPNWYCKRIDSLIYSKTPIRVIVPQTRLNNSTSIESFNYTVKGGSQDIYYTLSFKEHKVVGQERVVVI